MTGSLDSYDDRVKGYSPKRVGRLNAANARFPLARAHERRRVIEKMDLLPGLVIVDACAGGGYLVEGFPAEVQEHAAIYCTDTAEAFVATIRPPFRPVVHSMVALPFADNSVDRVSTLAGLHHVSRKDAFFSEVFRILKPGGLVVAADVGRDTAPDRWLNGAVDRWTDLGHDGMFVAPGEFSSLMEDAGFKAVGECQEHYPWTLPSWGDFLWYITEIFRLENATPGEIRAEVLGTFDVTEDDEGVHLPWELTHAWGRKPGGA